MKTQRRNISTPCCKQRVRVNFPYGDTRPRYVCSCGAAYRLFFDRTYNSKGEVKSGNLTGKEIIGRTQNV